MSQTWFEDVTDAHAIDYFESGYSYGCGVSAEDFDQDGDIDLFLASEPPYPCQLLENVNGTFSSRAFKVGFRVRSSLWVDHDGDHDLDLFVVGDPYDEPPSGEYIDEFWELFENRNGTYVPVAKEIGLQSNEEFLVNMALGGVAAGDLNLDGYLDLIITYWLGKVHLFMNQRDGTFEELILDQKVDPYFQPLVFDLTDDGFPEVYLPVDFLEPNRLYSHSGDMNFTDRATEANLDNRCDDMGLAFGDIDNDQDLDIYITCRELVGLKNILLTRDNDQDFHFSQTGGGPIGQGGWGWGTTFIDINNDRLLDISTTNGHRISSGYDQSKIWLNSLGNTFTDVSGQVNFADTLMASSLIKVDMDRDGDLDLIQTLKSEFIDFAPIRIYENKLEDFRPTNYLVIKPRMQGANHWAIGASVVLRNNGETLMQAITAGISFHGQEPAELVFGMGNWDKVEEVEIIWPGGGSTIVRDVASNQTLTITDEQAMHPPYGLVAETVDPGIELKWYAHSNTETNYIIERSENPGFSKIDQYQVPAEELEFIDTEIAAGRTYYYRIRSARMDEVSNASVTASATTPQIDIPAPGNLTAEVVGFSAVTLAWEDRSDIENGFRIARATNDSFENAVQFETVSNQVTYTDQSVEPGGRYYYRVKAFRNDGESAPSNTSEVLVNYQPLSGLSATESWRLFPNPAKGPVYIVGPENEEIESVRIFRLDGSVVWEMIPFTTEHMAPPGQGLFLIEIKTKSGHVVNLKLLRADD